jgi:ABC-type multidrug transport system ATPase subunit
MIGFRQQFTSTRHRYVRRAFRSAKRFGKVTAFDGLDLEIPTGQTVALLGLNGAGKTSLVRTIATLLRPDSGTIRVAGYDVVRDPVRVRASIGLAGQYATVDAGLTGRQNLNMFARLYGLKAVVWSIAMTVVLAPVAVVRFNRSKQPQTPTADLSDPRFEEIRKIFVGACRKSRTSSGVVPESRKQRP